MPGQHPKPPDDLYKQDLPVGKVSGPLWRICQDKYDEPLYFSSSGDYRFDSPEGEFGVCYLAKDLHGAFIEVFGRSIGVNLVSEQALECRLRVEVELARPLGLVDLTEDGLAKIGADNRLTGGGDYELSQSWALSLWNHPDEPDGILYRSRHDPSRLCVAVFDRASEILTVGSTIGLTDSRGWRELLTIITHYEFALD